MKIGTREVGPSAPVFVIAECGSNHGGSLDGALALIDAAAQAGADAAKFQRFRVDSFLLLVPRPDPEALRRYEVPDQWLPKLRARCDERGIEFLCTAFDFNGIKVVDEFVNAHKVGSYEAAVPEFSSFARSLGKPVIASCGRAEYPTADIRLRCVSEYPAKVAGYLRPEWLPRMDRAGWGVSDHTLDPTTVPAAAVALGACVVEKHMKMYRGEHASPDSKVSICADDFERMVRAIRATESAVRG